MNDRTEWKKVTKADPCPMCEKPDPCKVTSDGSVAMCKRIEQGAFKTAEGGWYFHRLKESPAVNGIDYVGKAHRSKGKAPAVSRKPSNAYPTAQAAIDAAAKMMQGRFVAGWTYRYRDGIEALQVIRFAMADGGKEYRPIHPVKDGWRIGDPPGPLPLYRLDQMATTGTVWVTEGEKAADAARTIGLTATTSAHGAGAAEKSDWTPLAGRIVVILPDHDEQGRKYAQGVARLLTKLDPPARVKIVDLPGLPDKGDVVEYIDDRADQSAEEILAAIEALADKTAELSACELNGGPVLVCLADVEPRQVSWLWPGRVPLGRLTLLVGRPGEGKSFLTTDMAARVTTGKPWPDGSDCPIGSVILISAEDDPGDTIRPRLDAHHADVKRVHLLSMVRRIGEDGTRRDVMFTLADVTALETAMKAHPDCKLIVIDPIGSFIGGGTDAHRDNEVRAVLAPVAMLAEKYGVAVVVVAHRRKGAGSNADETALGSRAFTGIARAVWHLSRDTENKARRLLLPGKNNLAPEGDGLAFTIGGDPPCISWERDPVAMSADDALAVENGGEENRKPGPEPRARKAAEEWLSGLLAGGEVPADQIKEEAAAAGLNYRTVQRAADALGVIREKNGFSKAWQWRFPKPGRVADELEVTGSQGNKNLSTCHLVEFDAKTAVLQCQDPEEDKSSDLVALDVRDKHNGRERGKL